MTNTCYRSKIITITNQRKYKQVNGGFLGKMLTRSMTIQHVNELELIILMKTSGIAAGGGHSEHQL